jgi:TIGR03009 family protein
MLIGWIKSGSLLVCLGVFAIASNFSLAQNQNNGQARSAQNQQQQNRQYSTPNLTPEQQAAQKQAAQQAFNEQERLRQQRVKQLANPQQPIKVVQPAGFPLDEATAHYVDQLLDFWETNSKKVTKYKCGFRRYEYDRGIVAWKDPQTNRLAAHSVVEGRIRFAAPDRARYETTRVMKFIKPPEAPGGQAEFREAENKEEREAAKELWICDGTTLFDFDFGQKRLMETQIPKDMQGNVTDSPLPFIFGAEKKAILDRYWVRSVVPTQGVENEYWLELYPKRASDARNYSKIEVIIAKEDFLPKAMHMYSAQYDPSKGNETSRYFAFENREVNNQLDKLGDFFGAFIRPRLPITGGWKRVDTQASSNQRQAAQTGPQQPVRRK